MTEQNKDNEDKPGTASAPKQPTAKKTAGGTTTRRKKPAARNTASTKSQTTEKPQTRSQPRPAGMGGPTHGKVLITGAAGGLAQHVMALLKGRYEVVGVEFRGIQMDYPDTVHYVVDFNKRGFEDVFREHEFDAIIHLGRIRFTQWSRGRRYSANVTGTARLLRLALKYGVKHVTALSTYHVYGADPANPSLIDEGYPMRAAHLMREITDAVELENLLNIYLYKHPELNIHILRPCNIAGPGISNEISRMLAQPVAPCLFGFSPLMQFIHVEDMANAVMRCLERNQPGVYNIAPDDYVAYQDALQLAGCRRLFLPSVPPGLARRAVRALGSYAPPDYLIDFFKYSVIIDGSAFARTFDFTPRHSLSNLLGHYRTAK